MSPRAKSGWRLLRYSFGDISIDHVVGSGNGLPPRRTGLRQPRRLLGQGSSSQHSNIEVTQPAMVGKDGARVGAFFVQQVRVRIDSIWDVFGGGSSEGGK